MRPNIAIPRPAIARMAAIDLDGFFGLHPALAPLKPLYDRGLLAPVHAVGSPSTTRSHFDAQDYMETGTPDVKGTPDGWLNRYLAVKGTCAECELAKASPFRAVALDAADAAHSRGAGADDRDEQSRRVHDSRDGHPGGATRGALSHRLGGPRFTARAREMFDAVKMLRAANPQKYLPENGARVSEVAVRTASDADRAARSRRTSDSRSPSPTSAAGTRT